MALSLLAQNRCSFGGCQLYFSNVDDLIAHIEFVHITPLEEEYRQKVSQAQFGPEENRASATPNMPLSCVYRLFRMPHNPQPCTPDVVRLNFNHYRKRACEASAPTGGSNVASSSSIKREDSSSLDSNGEDLNECGPNEQEDRFRCIVGECGKRFKCSAGLRLHSRTAHGVVLHENISGAHSALNGSGSVSSSHNGHPPPTVSPTKYAASRPYKCHQCSKRYKTTAGLSNHVEQSHKKQSGGGTQSSTDSAPASPSPAVLDQLISQARAHGQAAQEQQRAMTRPLPVQVASATSASGHQYGQMPSQAPLPVRSLSNTHARYSQNQISGQQGASQILHQPHMSQRRTQYGGGMQAQLVSSSSPHHNLQSGIEGSRTISSDNNDDHSRRYHSPHVAESGPILLTPKQS